LNLFNTIRKTISVKGLKLGGGNPLFLIAGPCVIESEEHTLQTAESLKGIAEEIGMPLIFKASYDKANRSSVSSYRGPGPAAGLAVLKKVGDELGIPLLSDVHRFEEIGPASDVLDILQIPAFLCRQTDFLIEAAKTGKTVNVKKGQFMAPWDMKNVAEKFKNSGNNNLIITERGASFGYNNLVTDIRAFPIMRSFGFPVVFDATHSVQLPGGSGTTSGGQREFVSPLARAAVAAGIDGIFFEVHENPDKALCDGPNSMPLDELKGLLVQLQSIDRIIKAGRLPDY